jgi:hypothetical protein
MIKIRVKSKEKSLMTGKTGIIIKYPDSRIDVFLL